MCGQAGEYARGRASKDTSGWVSGREGEQEIGWVRARGQAGKRENEQEGKWAPQSADEHYTHGDRERAGRMPST
ncbi:uncharacterized protein B0H18DRAFT_1064019, partial [Fomitopsis serialis]|uniref:uncharacterized protein n=1 Tax=Fomitopsis serialis TaxID=139415 RepID=UPI0020075FDA